MGMWVVTHLDVSKNCSFQQDIATMSNSSDSTSLPTSSIRNSQPACDIGCVRMNFSD